MLASRPRHATVSEPLPKLYRSHEVQRPWRVQSLLGGVALALVVGAYVQYANADRGHTRHAKIFWSGDFETGDLSQWWSVQAVPGDVRIVTSPVRQGSYAAKFVVRPGDVPVGGNGERSELRASQADSGGYSGRDEWYRWSTLFPRNLDPTPDTSWNFFVQWHDSQNNGCGPNVAYQIDAAKSPAKIKLRVRGGPISLSTCAARYDRSWRPVTLTLGHWYDLVLHVRWSAAPRVGFVQAWIDGKLVVRKTKIATLYPGDGVYVKQGFYRKPSGRVSTLYQDGMRRFDR